MHAAEAGTLYFIILTGYEEECGWTDIKIEVTGLSPPPAPSPPGQGMKWLKVAIELEDE